MVVLIVVNKLTYLIIVSFLNYLLMKLYVLNYVDMVCFFLQNVYNYYCMLNVTIFM